ncbi:HAMP domain-containing sensor histidine kinase [Prosthecobacter sp.]|uniref:sensor histidine kinase n=1 Tax=Prosthecobacter sp. TaxID=1965333 RepID=UPI001E0868B1|nr:HAMP domain-containing sensor histidine kinase [Prosthecobacter sp.]MCB1279401.1 HAMP domain-containing histidine kinase [Prosthecobacter sp.]
MSLRRRIMTLYIVTQCVSLVIVAFWSWFEFEEQREIVRQGGVAAVERESPFVETLEIVTAGGVPALVVGIFVGGLLLRRALEPIGRLTLELENTDISNLSRPVPRSGSGDEIDRMTIVFNSMKERLGASFTQAREFTLHASHELKTPLTILHGTLEQMLGDSAVPEAQKERISSMLEEVQRLAGIVGQLAFLAKADAGLLSFSHDRVAMDDLVRDLMEDLNHLSAPNEITVTLTECQPAIVRGDRMRLRQLLLNLADNAVKYNVPRGTITLSLKPVQGRICLEICNTGPVLPENLRARVFERFFRGDEAHGGDIEGSGLGLSIAQTIVQAHQGLITLQVSPEGLNCVTVCFPKIAE